MFFLHPERLFLLAAVPALALMIAWRYRRARRVVDSLGTLPAAELRPLLRRTARARLGLALAFGAIAFASAGPAWGTSARDDGIVRGRDLVVLLDLSRSMLADDCTDPDYRRRCDVARACLLNLADDLEARGGCRIALCVFAAKPWVLCPLTADIAHFRQMVGEYSPLGPPLRMLPTETEDFPSGTRIGSALRYAVGLHDPETVGFQEILLVSDGDDPAEDRLREIQGGVDACRTARIAVSVVGIGDSIDECVLAIADELISTRMRSDILRDIARQTGGTSIETREAIALGDWVRTNVLSRPLRELPTERLPQPIDRGHWFLLPAALWLAGSFYREGRR